MNGSRVLVRTAQQLSIGTSPGGERPKRRRRAGGESIWSGTINLGQVVLTLVRHCPLVGETATSTTLAAWLERSRPGRGNRRIG